METFTLKEDLRVLGVKVTTIPKGIGEAFDALVKMLPGGFDRSYYGIAEMNHKGEMIYKAAALEKYDGEAEKYNCERFTIEKGEYLAVTLRDWRKKTDSIKSVFQKMIEDNRVDKRKPCIEWYKNDDEMICMVKVASPNYQAR
jgi:predicted transcriptional regulator YdeE